MWSFSNLSSCHGVFTQIQAPESHCRAMQWMVLWVRGQWCCHRLLWQQQRRSKEMAHNFLSLGKAGGATWLLQAGLCHSGHEPHSCIPSRYQWGWGHMGRVCAPLQREVYGWLQMLGWYIFFFFFIVMLKLLWKFLCNLIDIFSVHSSCSSLLNIIEDFRW